MYAHLIWINVQYIAARNIAVEQRRDAMQKILVPVDGSPSADRAVAHVISMTKSGIAAEVHLLHVQPPLELKDIPDIAQPGLVERLGFDEADKAFNNAKKLLAESGVRYSARTATGDPAHEIALYADVHACDQIVMGTRGLGRIKTLVLGSVATKVLHLVGVPVTLVR